MASTQKRLPVNTAKRNIHQRQSRRCLFFGSVFILVFALYLLFSPVFLWAAPFSKYFQFASKNLVSTDAIAPRDAVITKDDALPDLQAPQGQAMSASVTEGDPFWVKARIYNGGTASAGASYVKLYLSTDNDFDVSDDYYVGEQPVGSLSAGESQWVEWDFTMPDLGSGSYSVWAVFVVDSRGQVSESDEDNTFIATSSFTANDPISEPCQKGDVNHNNSINSADAILVLRIAVGLISPDAYQACAADTNNSGSVNSADAILVLKAAVALPTIFYISPRSGPVGISVTIKGWNFGDTQGSSTVKFNGVVGTVASWSKSQIQANVPSGASSGTVVVTVGGVASNPVPFTVTVGGAAPFSVDAAGEPSSIVVGFPSKTGGAPGQRGVVVPIHISEAAGVAGADISLSYDPLVLKASDVQLTESTSGFALSTNINPGEVRISLARATGIDVLDKPIVNVIFDVLPSAAIGVRVPLRLESVSLYGDNAQQLGSRTEEGVFSVGYCISGQITDAKTGRPVSGVEVYFQDRFGTDISAVVTDKKGRYGQCGFTPERTPTVKVWVKPSTRGYRISPRKRSVAIADHDVTDIHFKARAVK